MTIKSKSLFNKPEFRYLSLSLKEDTVLTNDDSEEIVRHIDQILSGQEGLTDLDFGKVQAFIESEPLIWPYHTSNCNELLKEHERISQITNSIFSVL